MSVLAIGLLSVHDEDRYRRYVRAFLPVLGRFDGVLLAAGAADVVEGSIDHRRAVVLRFPTRERFEQWFDSDDYAAIAEDRRASASTIILCLEAQVPN